MGKKNINSKLKMKKLMKLLGVEQEFFAIRGIRFDRNIDDDDVPDNSIELFNNMNCETIDFSDMEMKEKYDGVKKCSNFQVVVRRDGKGDSIAPPNEFFPSLPFAIYILGVVKAGKSTLLDNIIELYEGAVDEIIFISPTAMLDGTAVEICDRYGIDKVYRSLAALTPLMKHLEKINAGKNSMKDKFKTLVIMDDCINEISQLARTKNSRLNQMCVNRRHLGINFICLSQKFKGCPPLFRANFNCFCLYRMENQAQKKEICEELSGFLGKDRFMEVFDEATHEPRSFLSINLDSSDKKFQYTKNFNQIIITDDFMSNKMDGIEKLGRDVLIRIARSLMIPTPNNISKKKLIELIKSKMENINDIMDEEDDIPEPEPSRNLDTMDDIEDFDDFDIFDF